MPIKKRIATKQPETHAIRWANFEGADKAEESDLTIDCNGAAFEEALKKAIYENDADEILVRICQYTPELDPGKFQAIVRFSDRNRPWAVCIHEDPFQAIAQAVMQAADMQGATLRQRTNKSGSNNQTRLPAKPAVSGVVKPAGKLGVKPKPTLRKTR